MADPLHRLGAPAGPILACLLATLLNPPGATAQSVVRTTPGGTPQVSAMRDAVTEDELRHQMGGVSMDRMMAQKARPVLEEVRPSPESSLLTGSLFLSDGEMFTVVPLGAVLHLPAEHRGHIVAKPEGTFTFWPSFLSRNAEWLAAKEVPLKMAKGNAEAAKAVLREASTDKRVVVSVYKGGPITILEPTPEAAAAAAKAASATEDSKPTKRSKGATRP